MTDSPARANAPHLPEVYSYLHHAFLCDVLRPHPSFTDWLASTFLRLYAHRDVHRSIVPFNFDVGDRLISDSQSGQITNEVLHYYRGVPILSLRTHARSALAAPDAAARLRAWTDEGWSVLLYLEKSALQGQSDRPQRPFVHQVLLTKARAGLETVRVHYMNDSGRYVRVDTDLSRVIAACNAARLDAPHRRTVVLLQPNTKHTQPSFTQAALHREVNRSIRGEGTTVHDARDTVDLAYGLDASELLRQWAVDMIAGRLPLDIRPFHVYMEHKQRLLAALQLLAERGQPASISDAAVDDAVRLAERAFALRFFILRSRTVGVPPGAGIRWEEHLDQTLTLERDLYHRLYQRTSDRDRM